LPIDMTEAQVVECERILRGAGYSHAWALDSTDPTERVFLVPESELDWGAPVYVGFGAPLDWVAHTESPLMRETSIGLTGVFPGTKVFIGELKDNLPVTQLY
jgi:hypothetical protein